MDFKEGITVNGDKLPNNFSSEENANYLSKMLIEVLVKLHNINPSDVGLENFGKPIGFLERQLKGWYKRGVIAHYKNSSKAMEKLYKLLYSSSIPKEEEFVILHNDFKLDNIILNFHQIKIYWNLKQLLIGIKLQEDILYLILQLYYPIGLLLKILLICSL